MAGVSNPIGQRTLDAFLHTPWIYSSHRPCTVCYSSATLRCCVRCTYSYLKGDHTHTHARYCRVEYWMPTSADIQGHLWSLAKSFSIDPTPLITDIQYHSLNLSKVDIIQASVTYWKYGFLICDPTWAFSNIRKLRRSQSNNYNWRWGSRMQWHGNCPC